MGAGSKPSTFEDDVRTSAAARARVRKLVRTGRWREAEPSVERRAAYNDRMASIVVTHGAEAKQGATDDLQVAAYLTEGAQVRRAVAYVEVNDVRSSTVGSGFLISPHLFLTNCHVIRDADAARAAQLTFDREMTPAGVPMATTTYLLNPDEFALFSEVNDLDYALIAVGRLNSGATPLAELGYCVLADTPDRHRLGMNVNVIQHPGGLPKMIAIRNNILTYRTDRTLLYETDTEEGSSGAPVFNDAWDVVALHHWGQPYLEEVDEDGKPLPVTVNEGVRISGVYRNLASRVGSLSQPQRLLLEEALAYSTQLPSGGAGRVLSPPRPLPTPAPGPERSTTDQRKGLTAMSQENEVRVTIPVEVSVRIGSSTASSGGLAAALTPARRLTKGAEALQVDADYSNRDGYQQDFISSVTIPVPAPNATLAKQVASLRAGEPNPADGELKYEHFSVKMNKAKHLAMFTATNIDGATYLAVDRDTGEVRAGPEGDKWFKDPRISESFWTGQEFYSEWSNYFDRGHLTRRTDPSWGTPEEAERANVDTFHWTNCSPQHFRFNQTTKFWQGAERYVLENGLLEAGTPKRLCVFQGPLFDDTIDQFAGDLQIPSSFFKIIVWKGAQVLKAVGLVVDQLTLLSEQRVSLGQPREVSSVNVSQWRVAIPKIEKRAGLSFGDVVRAADTIKSIAQPDVGAEAAVRIASFEDILR